MPADWLFLGVCHFLRIDAHLHAIVEQRVKFSEIHDIETDGPVFSGVFNLKVEPLRVAASVNVVLHQQIVLGVVDLLSKVQVA